MLILSFIYEDFMNKKFNNLKNNGSWIGVGTAIGVATNEPTWIVLGVTIGAALGWKKIKIKKINGKFIRSWKAYLQH